MVLEYASHSAWLAMYALLLNRGAESLSVCIATCPGMLRGDKRLFLAFKKEALKSSLAMYASLLNRGAESLQTAAFKARWAAHAVQFNKRS